MKKTDEVKQKIIDVTIELIMNSNGNINEITTRSIAEKAKIGIGLINYHFQTKENLIEIGVQAIISSVISNFKPKLGNELTGIQKIKLVASEVMDFLFQNDSVSRISILKDLTIPDINNNSIKTMKGFTFSLSDYDLTDKEKMMLTFGLTSIIQSIFLRKAIIKELFNMDIQNKEERDSFLEFFINRLFINKVKN